MTSARALFSNKSLRCNRLGLQHIFAGEHKSVHDTRDRILSRIIILITSCIYFLLPPNLVLCVGHASHLMLTEWRFLKAVPAQSTAWGFCHLSAPSLRQSKLPLLWPPPLPTPSPASAPHLPLRLLFIHLPLLPATSAEGDHTDGNK